MVTVTYVCTAYNTTRAVAYEVAQGTVDAVYIGGDISYAVGYLGMLQIHCILCYWL